MSHGRLSVWLFDAEMNIQALESSIAIVSSGLGFQGSTIDRLETELGEFRSLLDIVNQIGPQLQQRRTEEASFIETLVARDNGRFNVVCEQIQRKAEGLHLSRLRSMEVIGDLLDWFRETESHLREAEPPSSNPEVIHVQLKEYKILGDEIASL
jgi:dystonin